MVEDIFIPGGLVGISGRTDLHLFLTFFVHGKH
jgi:hypothetical protein